MNDHFLDLSCQPKTGANNHTHEYHAAPPQHLTHSIKCLNIQIPKPAYANKVPKEVVAAIAHNTICCLKPT